MTTRVAVPVSFHHELLVNKHLLGQLAEFVTGLHSLLSQLGQQNGVTRSRLFTWHRVLCLLVPCAVRSGSRFLTDPRGSGLWCVALGSCQSIETIIIDVDIFVLLGFVIECEDGPQIRPIESAENNS